MNYSNSGGYGLAPNALAGQQAQPNPSALAGVNQDLERALKDLHSILGRAGDLANRVMGPVPEAVGNNVGAEANAGNCAVGQLERLAGYIGVTVNQLGATIARLERL